jgi:hypothetical protein
MQNIYEMLLKHLRFHMISCNGIVEREMFDIPRLYTSACSYAVQPVRLYPILMSILLHHFKVLTECTKEVERIEAKVSWQMSALGTHSRMSIRTTAATTTPKNKNLKEEGLTEREEEQQEKAEEEMPTPLDGFL